MAYDMFLKIEGIAGESKDDKHPNEIVLESFSWGETNTGAHLGATGGAGAGKVSMQDFHFTARVSKASPALMLACASGKHIPTAQMSVRKAGESPQDFLFMKFNNLLVSSFQFAGDANDRPLDSVSMAFQKIEIDYKEQKASGQLGSAVTFGWDLKANRKV